jgi:hypothetical protein
MFNRGQNLKCMHAELYSATFLHEVSGRWEEGETCVIRGTILHSANVNKLRNMICNETIVLIRIYRGSHITYNSQWLKLGRDKLLSDYGMRKLSPRQGEDIECGLTRHLCITSHK